MAKKIASSSESYLLIKDANGFKVLHPVHGSCRLVDVDGNAISGIDFSRAIVGDHPADSQLTEVWGEGEDLTGTIDALKSDGYTSKEIKKLRLRVETVATI